MSTAPINSSRYKNTNIQRLVQDLQNQTEQYESLSIAKIQRDRKTHQSCCEMIQRQRQRVNPDFNNKTQIQGKLFDGKLKSVPYMYLPKHKHDNLIIPDRAFAKGKAGKRFFIKMKDTSVYSFQLDEDEGTNKTLQKQQKEKTIMSRKLDQLERIIDRDDGKIKAQANKWFLLNRRTFRPPSNVSDLFSQIDPMLQPRNSLDLQFKRIPLTRTFSKQSKWRPSTQNNNATFFSATSEKSMFARTGTLKKRTYK